MQWVINNEFKSGHVNTSLRAGRSQASTRMRNGGMGRNTGNDQSPTASKSRMLVIHVCQNKGIHSNYVQANDKLPLGIYSLLPL